MSIVFLTPAIIFKITAKASLYDAAPFLAPMKSSALKTHKRVPKSKVKCSSCVRNAIDQFSRQLANAFTALVVKEKEKDPNELAALRGEMSRILNMPITEVQLSYKDLKGNSLVLQF